MMPSSFFNNSIQSAHIWTKKLGDKYGAIGLLVVFDNGEPGAAHGETAAIEGMHELRFGLCARRGCGAVADVGTARLKGVEVGAGRDFAIKILARQPDLEVVRLGGGETGVAGAEEDAAVGQAESFKNLLGIPWES